MIVESVPQARDEFFAGRCQAYTSDASTLAAHTDAGARAGRIAFRILPDRISKEPFGPVVNRGDEQWATLVKWVLLALVEAEERGITRANVRNVLDDHGRPGGAGLPGRRATPRPWASAPAGWCGSWRAVGNYGEMFERNLGSGAR